MNAELEADRLKAITKQLAEDVRPLVGRLQPVVGQAHPLMERARLWMADAMDPLVPLVEQMRPVFNDLRPVMRDVRALLAELLHLLGGAAARLDLGPMKSVAQVAGASAERLASIRPTLPSTGAIHQPHVSLPRVPSVRPRIGGAASALARRLRPGLWAFRTAAIGLILLVASQPWLRDAMVDEVNWTRSVVQTIEIPAIQIPNIELPTFQIPNFEIPTFQFASQEPAPPKLAQATFELPPLNAYRAAFETQASYPTVPPNATVEWVVALRNTGSAGWYRGVAGAQAALALTDGTEAAVQTTAYVAPGQVGWFIVHFRAPTGPGAHAVALFPRIDGRGELPNLGLYALVTVR